MNSERVDNLDRMIDEERVIRGAWTEGKERACLLAALSPEAGSAEDAEACPAWVMPGWLAHLTVCMDDNGSNGAWPSMVRRYAALARRWNVLDDAAWERAKTAALVAILEEAVRHTEDEAALAAMADVRERIAEGASEAALKAAARAAGLFRWVGRAAAWAVDADASWAVGARAAEAAAEAAAGDAAGTARDAWDRMTSRIFDAIEAEIERVEG